MYWSRKFRLFDCNTATDCRYTGLPKNDARHSIKYNLSNCDATKGGCNNIRKNRRVRNNKEEMAALRARGKFNDIYKNRLNVDGNANIKCNRSLAPLYRRNQPAPRGTTGSDNNYSYSYNEFLRIKKMVFM